MAFFFKVRAFEQAFAVDPNWANELNKAKDRALGYLIIELGGTREGYLGKLRGASDSSSGGALGGTRTPNLLIQNQIAKHLRVH